MFWKKNNGLPRPAIRSQNIINHVNKQKHFKSGAFQNKAPTLLSFASPLVMIVFLYYKMGSMKVMYLTLVHLIYTKDLDLRLIFTHKTSLKYVY